MVIPARSYNTLLPWNKIIYHPFSYITIKKAVCQSVGCAASNPAF